MSRKKRRGQALVEFALVLPMLAVLLFAIIEFARVWNAKQLLTDAAREGARVAVVGDPSITDTATQVNPRIRAIIERGGFDVSSTALTIEYPDGFKTGSGQITSVRLTFPYHWKVLPGLVRLLTFGAAVLPPTINLQSTARMRNE
jgi:hypothetical protein